MSRFTSALALLLVLSLVLLAGCSRDTRLEDEQAIRATIERYNELLSQGYASQDMTAMREVADELQAEDEYIHMASLGEGGVRLLATLGSLEFESISIEATAALVETRELWDYEQQSTVTGETVLVQKGLLYILAWDLVKASDSRWYVTDVRAIDATATAPASEVGTVTPLARP